MISNKWNKYWDHRFDYVGDLERDYKVFSLIEGIKGKVLDVGCGNGNLLAFLISRGYEAKGLDFSNLMVSLCKKRRLDVVQGDAEVLPFKDNSFEIIIASGLLEYLDNDNLFLKEAFRVLKRDGILIVSFRNSLFSSWSGREYEPERRVHNPELVNFDNFEFKKIKYFHRHYPNKGLKNKFCNSGFIMSFKELGGER